VLGTNDRSVYEGSFCYVTTAPSYYGQVAATIFTSSTFSFGAVDEVDADVAVVEEVEDVDDDEGDESRVPVTSTLCPTCGDSFASVASRRYSLAALIPERLVVPVVPAVLLVLLLPLPMLALVRMNLGSVLLAADEVDPVVPVGLACARCTQPVTVIVFGVVCGDVSCARTPTEHAIDANTADNTLSFIFPPADRYGRRGCNSSAD
jgi:hypothetical protein